MIKLREHGDLDRARLRKYLVRMDEELLSGVQDPGWQRQEPRQAAAPRRQPPPSSDPTAPAVCRSAAPPPRAPPRTQARKTTTASRMSISSTSLVHHRFDATVIGQGKHECSHKWTRTGERPASSRLLCRIARRLQFPDAYLGLHRCERTVWHIKALTILHSATHEPVELCTWLSSFWALLPKASSQTNLSYQVTPPRRPPTSWVHRDCGASASPAI